MAADPVVVQMGIALKWPLARRPRRRISTGFGASDDGATNNEANIGGTGSAAEGFGADAGKSRIRLEKDSADMAMSCRTESR